MNTHHYVFNYAQTNEIYPDWIRCYISMSYLSTWRIPEISLFAYIGALILLVITLFKGEAETKGTRWLTMFGFRFQPSEFAKISLILFVTKCWKKIKLLHLKTFSYTTLSTAAGLYHSHYLGGVLYRRSADRYCFIMLLISRVRFSHIAKGQVLWFCWSVCCTEEWCFRGL